MGPLESDFDATIYTAEFVTAEADEPIAAILEKVEAALERTPSVVLIIPRGSFAFHSTHDFLALGKLHGGREVRVAVATPDPTIASLARVLGFHIEDVPPDHPAMEHASSGGRPPLDTEQPTAPLPLPIGPLRDAPDWVLSQQGGKYPAPSITTSTWLNNPGDPVQPIQFDAARNGASHAQPPHLSAPLPRRGVPPPRTRPRQTGHLQLQPAIITDPSLPSITSDRFTPAPPLVSSTQSGRIKARRVDDQAAAYVKLDEKDGVRTWRRSSVRRVVAVVLTMLLLAAGGAGAYIYIYLPEGTVQVTPLNKDLDPVQIQVPVLTTAGGSNEGNTAQTATSGTSLAQTGVSTRSLAATPITASIALEDTANATGTRTVVKGRGVGTMHFINHVSNPITIARGTQFKSPNGVLVQITEGGVLKPTIFGAGFGELDLPVAAMVEGPQGNVPAGQLQGSTAPYEYNNRTDLQGGTTETLKVITQKDIDDLVGKLKAKALDAATANGLIVSQVTADQQLITQTLHIDEPAVEVDHKAKEDGEMVHAKVGTRVQAYAFKKSEVRDAVAQAMWDWVQANYSPTVGPEPDKNSLRFDAPALSSFDAAQGRAFYTTLATAHVKFNLTPTLKNQILQLVTGKNIAQARTLITGQYGQYVNAGPIQAKVLGFDLDKLPTDPARITILGPGSSFLAPAQATNAPADDPSSQR